MDDTYIRRTDAAELLGVTVTTLDRWAKNEDIPIAPADVPRPGVWYRRADLEPLIVTSGS